MLLQMVSWNDAFRAWRLLALRLGSEAPGPYKLRLAPPAEKLRPAEISRCEKRACKRKNQASEHLDSHNLRLLCFKYYKALNFTLRACD